MTGDSDPIRLVSELPEPKQRFLARVVDYALQDGWRSPEDFMSLFPPETLIESLAEADALRVKILVEATGMHERIALKKSISSASEDLRLALEEGMTSASTLVEQYPPDDKVRHLDNQKLWDFATEDEFWKTQASIDKPAHTKAAARLTFMLECALSEGLINLKDIADGMTFHEIATAMPVMELQEVVKHALQIARADAPLTEERLLAVVPLNSIVEFVSLEHTYERVVVNKIAAPCGFTDALGVPSSKSTSFEATPAAPKSEPAAAKPPAPAPPTAVASAPPPPASGSAPPKPRDSDRPAEEDAARKRVMERLQSIERLPPKHDELLTPILLSIESMYSDLSALEDDEEREACIRESFPNANHLRTAMLALIELLDPSINTEDPVIHDADVDGLIKIVLFEERRRSDNGGRKGSSPSSARRAARRSVPPPLPKSSTPPPLPEEGGRRKQR